MNLYICTKISHYSTEICCVVADNEEHAKDILKNDGRNLYSIETWFPLSSNYVLADSGIPFSIDVVNENQE